MPKLSLITATFNAAATISNCLDSVHSQNIGIEHIVIDGESNDGTLLVLQEAHADLAHLVSEPDNGIYDAMNKGIALATGDVVGILNADDFYPSPNTLSKVLQVFEDPKVDACYGDLLYVQDLGYEQSDMGEGTIPDERQGAIGDRFKILRYWKSGEYNCNKFKWGWMPPHPTFFVRRRVYEQYGLFNLDLGSAADYELMLRFLYKHRIKCTYIPEVLVHMRTGGVSNASLQNRLAANHMDRKAWEVNELRPYPWTLWMKPLRKIPQYFLRP